MTLDLSVNCYFFTFWERRGTGCNCTHRCTGCVTQDVLVSALFCKFRFSSFGSAQVKVNLLKRVCTNTLFLYIVGVYHMLVLEKSILIQYGQPIHFFYCSTDRHVMKYRHEPHLQLLGRVLKTGSVRQIWPTMKPSYLDNSFSVSWETNFKGPLGP